MWQRFGDIKSNLGELTNKALTSAAKAGSRAKEILKEVDNEDFFEKEHDTSPSNLSTNPEFQSKDKSNDWKQFSKSAQLQSNDNNLFGGDSTEAASILDDSNSTKTLSWKEEKRQEVSPVQTRQAPSVDPSKKNVAKSLESFNPVALNKKFSFEKIEENKSNEAGTAKINRDLEERGKSEIKSAGIQTGTLEDRKQEIREYIHACIEQFREEMSKSIIEDLNANVLKQIAVQEEAIYGDVKNLLDSWTKNSNSMHSSANKAIPEEQLVKLFSDDIVLREEIEIYKNEARKYKIQAEELEELVKQLQAHLGNETGSLRSSQEGLKDNAGLERKVKNLEDELNEYKTMLQDRYTDIQRLEKALQEKDSGFREMEAQLKREITANEDLRQQYEGLVPGMKEFEEAMSQINKENENLTSQYESMKAQLAQERKRIKDLENSVTFDTKEKLVEKLSKLNVLVKGLEIENIINSRIIYKEGRVSTDTLVEAIDQSVTQILGMVQHRKADSQPEEDKGREGRERERFHALLKDYERIQSELKEALKREKEILSTREELRKENEELTDIVQNLNSLGAQHANRIKDLQKANGEFKDAQKKHKDELKAKNEEIDHLKTKYNMLVEQANLALDSAAKVEAEAELIPELNSKLEDLVVEVGNLNEIIRAKNDENERLNTTIMNLQAVIDDSQSLQDNTIGQYTNEIKRLRSDLEQVSRKSQILQEYKEKFEVLEKEFADRENRVRDLNIRLKESEQEKNVITAEASAILKKAKSEATYKEHLVDKRVITSFLMKYFDSNATFPVKLGILETMSSILSFTEDERGKLGLPRQGPGAQEIIGVKPKLESPVMQQKTEFKFEEEKADKKELIVRKKSVSEGDTLRSAEVQGEKKEEKESENLQPQKSLKQMFMSFLLENE